MNCGDARLVRPSIGSWVTYGLGSENQNLPGFIAMCPGGYPIQETQNWQSGFLPGAYQGTYIDTRHTDIDKLDREHPQRLAAARRNSAGSSTCCASSTNGTRRSASTTPSSKRASSRSSWPTACRWTPPTPSISSREPQAHSRDVRPGRRTPGSCSSPAGCSSRACASSRSGTARASRGTTTTTSKSITASWRRQCDQAIGALLKRPEAARHARRHAGHLGRRVRPHAHRRIADARRERRQDQRPRPQPLRLHACGWPAAASRAATSTARPTSSASQAVENKVHVHDLHATILHLLGFDHEKLTYRYAGRDFRLTDVHGKVVKEILA